MPAPSKNNFLDHIRLLRQSILARGGDLIIAGNSMQALLRQGAKHWVLYPQFLAKIDGINQYTTIFSEEASHFAGWLPYYNKRWKIATDKLAFKQFVTNAGLRTPIHSETPDIELEDIVIKRKISSFGEQVWGPFRSSNERKINIDQGEYYERFVQGRLLKIWYWNAEPVCVEVDRMPSIIGNGRSTIKELLIERANLSSWQGEEEIENLLNRTKQILQYHNINHSTILGAQIRQIVEFRYGSNLMLPYDRVIFNLKKRPNPNWTMSLFEIGQKLHSSIPESDRQNTAFTVDAVINSENQIWLLEMNSNPTIHPLLYPVITESLTSENYKN